MARGPQRRSGVRGLLNSIDSYRARSSARAARREAGVASGAAAEASRAPTQGQGVEVARARGAAARAQREARNAQAARDRIRRRGRR